MRRCLLILLLVIFLSGCSAMSYLDIIPPNTAFTNFEYHRGGNVTSAHIVATDAIFLEDGSVLIDSVNINADYGPAVNFSIKLEGYEVTPSAVQE